jgi:transcriptional repressor NrdR
VLPAVIKRDRRREPFDEQKLREGMQAAAQKRPVAAEAIEDAIERIVHRLQTLGEREVESSVIGDLAMEELHALDEVAYVRFASIYRSFHDVTQFQDEIDLLKRKSPGPRRKQMSLLPDEES